MEHKAAATELEASARAWATSVHWPAAGWVLSMVVSPDGAFSGADGSSRSISSSVDRQLILGYRDCADLVITSAKTAKLEGYRASGSVKLLFLSRFGRFGGIPALEGQPNTKPGQVFTASWLGALLSQHTAPSLRLPFRLSRLARLVGKLGCNRVLVEAGPALTRKLIAAGLITEIRLSVMKSQGQKALEQLEESALNHLSARGFNKIESVDFGDLTVSRWVFNGVAASASGNHDLT